MKRLLVTVILMTSLVSLQAQNYRTGIGVRLGGLSSGITVKHFVKPSHAIEGIAGFGHHHFILTGLYEKHNPFQNAAGLSWLYGGGIHIGFFNHDDGYYYHDHGHHHYYYYADDGEHAVVPGIDFIIGLDYKFNNAPLNLGLDLKPFVDFHDGLSGYFDGALSFRFVF